MSSQTTPPLSFQTEAEVSEAITGAFALQNEEEAESALKRIRVALESNIKGDDSPSDEPLNSIALSCVPILFPSGARSPGSFQAKLLLSLIASHSSAREVLLALDECLQPNHPTQVTSELADPPSTLERITVALLLYEICLPRVPIRKRAPAAILEPVLSGLSKAFSTIPRPSEDSDNAPTQRVLHRLAEFVETVSTWSTQWYTSTGMEGFEESKNQLETFLLSCITSIASWLQNLSGFSLRSFQFSYPRYRNPRLNDNQALVTLAEVLSGALQKIIILWMNILSTESLRLPSELTSDSLRNLLPSLILALEGWNIRELDKERAFSRDLPLELARVPALPALSDRLIHTLLAPALVESRGVEHIVGFLALSVELDKGTEGEPNELSDVGRSTLVDCLAPIAATHTDAVIRHIAFRLIETYIVADIQDDGIRQSVLMELINESPFPQMQSAAIGILRNVVARSLPPRTRTAPAPASAPPSVFASPSLFESFSRIIFSVRPEGLLNSFAESSEEKPDAQATRTFVVAFSESPEPARLVEALGLYYILLAGDSTNQTGVCTKKNLDAVESALVEPLRSALMIWQDCDDEDVQEIMHSALSALCMALERVDAELDRAWPV